MKPIYLDNAATTKTDERVMKEMLFCLKEGYGNPSSAHFLGEKARELIDEARKSISMSINAKPEEIIFTSGATESNNLAILGVAKANPSKRTIIISDIEHPSVIQPCEYLAKVGYKIVKLKTYDEGIIKLNDLNKSIIDNKDILLVSIMHVNNIIGTIQPIYEIAELCKSKGVLFHTDAVQSFGKIDIDVTKGIDLLSASGHKIGGPKGSGIIYIKSGIKVEPLIYGGGQEKGLRSGTENVPAIVGFAKALEIIKKVDKKKIKILRDKLISELENLGGKINGSKEERIYNNANVSFDIDSDLLVQYLSDKGIYVSSGSACESKKEMAENGGIRIVLNEETTDKDIRTIIRFVKTALRKLK